MIVDSSLLLALAIGNSTIGDLALAALALATLI